MGRVLLALLMHMFGLLIRTYHYSFAGEVNTKTVSTSMPPPVDSDWIQTPDPNSLKNPSPTASSGSVKCHPPSVNVLFRHCSFHDGYLPTGVRRLLYHLPLLPREGWRLTCLPVVPRPVSLQGPLPQCQLGPEALPLTRRPHGACRPSYLSEYLALG